MKKKLTVCLFEGRHQLPENEGALFSSFDFTSFKGERTRLCKTALHHFDCGGELEIIVTGLTPALTEILSVLIDYFADIQRWNVEHIGGGKVPVPSLSLLHFNSSSGEYISQKIM